MSDPAKHQAIDQILANQQQPIEYLVFSGGGAKGAIYCGVHAGLVDSGLLKGAKALAGSSVGAIVSAAIASGISKEDYAKLSKDTNLKKLLGAKGVFNKDGKPLRDLVAKVVRNNIVTYFNTINIKEAVQQELTNIEQQLTKINENNSKFGGQESKDLQQKLQAQILQLSEWANNNYKDLNDLKAKSNTNEDITFKDLALLQLLNPVKFKGLIITAIKQSDGNLILFNDKNTPDISIADACRASASLPLVLQPHTIDGGFADQIPMGYFNEGKLSQDQGTEIEDITHDKNKIQEAKTQGRTMCFAFDLMFGDDAGFKAVYSAKKTLVGSHKIANFLVNVIFKKISGLKGKFSFIEEQNKSYENLRKNAGNTVLLNTGKIGVLSFNEAQNQSDYLNIKGYLQVMNYVNNYEFAQEVDLNLEYKNFILDTYEKISHQSFIEALINTKINSHTKQLDSLLNLCKEEAWKDKLPNEILSELVTIVATNKVGGELTTSTSSMKKLIKQLNNPQTPDIVKEKFIKLLEIDNPNDRLNDSKQQKNFVKFQFTPKDFTLLISNKVPHRKEDFTKPQGIGFAVPNKKNQRSLNI